MTLTRGWVLALAPLLAACVSGSHARDAKDAELETIETFTGSMEVIPGFLPSWWDGRAGRLYLEPPSSGEELLYLVSLPAGLGSNLVGLDRAQLGPRWVAHFRRVGPKVLLVAPNLEWTSSAEDPLERAGVADSFASSVLWGFNVAAETEGRALIDATEFLLRDAHGVERAVREAGQGSFKLDAQRSTLWPQAIRGYPDNTEVEALLTFGGDAPGPEIAATAAEATAISVRVRHSFVRLEDLDSSGYRPRRFDPRCGFFRASFKDFASAIDAPLQHSFVTRHDLRPGGPPIIYYIDRAAPEPVRTALLQGARYWEPVFEAAGFPGGFRAEIAPEDLDLQDIRHNVITWVSRASRGWSYGGSVFDPRTGRILKGHVSLGALRVRQDVLIAEGLLAPYEEADRDARVLEMALARIRQLSAHEIGHTLGLAHNFAASTVGRASVMDYPAPLVHLDEAGNVDLSDAYAPGCGIWDELAIRYGYGWCPPEQEGAFLQARLSSMEQSGVPFLTDSDARGADRAHPLANLWDNGDDPVAMLRHEMRVRQVALGRFSAAVIPRGEPLASLEHGLVPLYFHHRYQLEAAVRQIGGVSYRHAVRGGRSSELERVPDEVQRAALGATLDTLEPSFLELPAGLHDLIPPPAPGDDPAAERFDDGSLLLDADGIAAAGIRMTLKLLLDPTRAARLVDQEAEAEDMLGFGEVCVALLARGWTRPGTDRGALRAQLLERWMDLAVDAGVPQRVQRVALNTLAELRRLYAEGLVPDGTIEERRQAVWETTRLDAFFEDLGAPRPRLSLPTIPRGSPIGCQSAAL